MKNLLVCLGLAMAIFSCTNNNQAPKQCNSMLLLDSASLNGMNKKQILAFIDYLQRSKKAGGKWTLNYEDGQTTYIFTLNGKCN